MKAIEAIGRNLLTYEEYGRAIAELPPDPRGKPYRAIVNHYHSVEPLLHDFSTAAVAIPYLIIPCKRWARDGRRFWLWDVNPEVVEYSGPD